MAKRKAPGGGGGGADARNVTARKRALPARGDGDGGGSASSDSDSHDDPVLQPGGDHQHGGGAAGDWAADDDAAAADDDEAAAAAAAAAGAPGGRGGGRGARGNMPLFQGRERGGVAPVRARPARTIVPSAAEGGATGPEHPAPAPTYDEVVAAVDARWPPRGAGLDAAQLNVLARAAVDAVHGRIGGGGGGGDEQEQKPKRKAAQKLVACQSGRGGEYTIPLSVAGAQRGAAARRRGERETLPPRARCTPSAACPRPRILSIGSTPPRRRGP
jgi:hypothetical protein